MMEMSTIRQNIEMQLAEVELLQSMYPREQELQLNNVKTIEVLREWLENDQTLGKNFPRNFL